MQPTLWDFTPTKMTTRKPKRPSRKPVESWHDDVAFQRSIPIPTTPQAAYAGYDVVGKRCLLDGRPAFVRNGGDVATVEPVDLSQEPIYVKWKDVAATMEIGGKFFTPRN